MRRNSANARRSLELFIMALPRGGKNQKTNISAAMAVAMSPFNNPSSLETARTASRSKSIEASLPMFIRWQNAAMQSRTMVEKRVPGRDRTWNSRARSMEKAAPKESSKKVPQTPSRQPATNPAVKPPIPSSLRKKTHACISGKSNSRVMPTPNVESEVS